MTVEINSVLDGVTRCFTCMKHMGLFDAVAFRDQIICESCFDNDDIIQYLMNLKKHVTNPPSHYIRDDSTPPIHPFFC